MTDISEQRRRRRVRFVVPSGLHALRPDPDDAEDQGYVRSDAALLSHATRAAALRRRFQAGLTNEGHESVNTTSFSFRSVEERRCTFSWRARYLWGGVPMALPCRRRAGSRRGHGCASHVHWEWSRSAEKYCRLAVVIGFLKGKERHTPSAGVWRKPKRNFVGQSFWARGYFVSTIGRDEEVIRNYIRKQEQEDERPGADELLAANGHFSDALNLGSRHALSRQPLSAAHTT